VNFIYNFRDLRKENIPLAGGKGANLGELVYANMPVPPGFVVTTIAYDSFIDTNNLEEVITKEIQSKNEKGESIRNAFIKSHIPEGVKNDVLKAYKELGGGSVAVRSSATAEDLPNASFAGQQDTYLNIIGEKELLDAVRRTWASLWTERAISYRIYNNIDQKKVKLAVVVQKMIDADFAGVMFTANPINGNRKEIVIDANPGLGEALVSGLVTPDHFIMDKQWGKWHFVKILRGKHTLIVKSKKGGGIERIEKTNISIDIPQKTLLDLANLGLKIQKHFSAPQDIEWVWFKKKLYIVQSRPITALPDELPKQNKINRVISEMIAEMMPKRQLPLESTLFSLNLVIDDFMRPLLDLIGLRIPKTSEFLIEEDGVFVRYNGKIKLRPTFSIFLAPFRLLKVAYKNNSSDWEKDIRVVETIKKVKEFESKNYTELSSGQIADIAKEAYERMPILFKVRVLYLPRAVLSMGALYVLLALIGQKRFFGVLLFSGITTKVTQTNDKLKDLSLDIRKNKDIYDIFMKSKVSDIHSRLNDIKQGQEFLHTFQEFLTEYGYRESGGTMLISEPTWKESPEIVFEILKTLAQTPLREKTKEEWHGICNLIVTKSVLRFYPFRSLFLKLLTTARHFQEIRENTRFYLMMIVPVLRDTALEIGNRFAKVGILTDQQDVFYFKFNELIEVAKSLPIQASRIDELKNLIAKRKLKYKNLKNTPVVDPRLYRIKNNEKGAILTGTAGSSGIAEGTARIIRNSSEFDKLQHNDILIAPYTNPSWTPLFERALGIVVDTGGAMSHAAIVAREYGIPAVMGTVDGTTKIKDGDKIRIDGTSGSVFTIKN